MAIDPPPPNKERERLCDILNHSAKRVTRAIEKAEAAERELDLALSQAARAQAELDAWAEANPDPQGSLL